MLHIYLSNIDSYLTFYFIFFCVDYISILGKAFFVKCSRTFCRGCYTKLWCNCDCN